MPPMIVAIELKRGEVTARTHAKIARDAYRATSEYHVAFHMPTHFEENPSTRPGGPYGYEQRSERWRNIKQRLVGHQKPNVLTGAMRVAILGGAKIAATQHRTTIRLRNYFPMRPERWAEMKAITPGEFRTLRGVAQREYNRLAALPENKRQRRERV